jgi:hypothetical protein
MKKLIIIAVLMAISCGGGTDPVNTPPPCAPRTCQSSSCVTVNDGCGGQLRCGPPVGYFCCTPLNGLSCPSGYPFGCSNVGICFQNQPTVGQCGGPTFDWCG